MMDGGIISKDRAHAPMRKTTFILSSVKKPWGWEDTLKMTTKVNWDEKVKRK